MTGNRTRVPQPLWIFRLLTRAHARVYSISNAPLSPRQRSYPVLIMRGGTSAGVQAYSTLAADLASHGYVVVGIDAPYRTGRVVFPDGWSNDSTPTIRSSHSRAAIPPASSTD